MPPITARALLVTALAAGLVLGIAAPAGPLADPDLVRLLRAMAALKLLFVAAAVAAMLWRLQAPIAPPRLAAYTAATLAMAAGPGLIWTMAHVALGAALLHLGLLASLLLLWRDPAAATLLSAAVAGRRLRRQGCHDLRPEIALPLHPNLVKER